MRDATTSPLTPVPLIPFQSTRPMRDATSLLTAIPSTSNISIHASHAGRDPVALTRSSSLLFQSTRPMRDATNTNSRQSHHDAISIHASHAGRDEGVRYTTSSLNVNFNPRVPCGTRLVCGVICLGVSFISIHASHAGRDGSFAPLKVLIFQFQSTRPMRDATYSPLIGASTSIFQSTRPMRDATHKSGLLA